MSKVAHYLQEHLSGEVSTAPDVRRFFATDASIFDITPALVVYPRGENDVRKTARFTWQLAKRGRVIPITARGLGTDQSGAALGEGIIIAFPAHMDRILEIDGKSGDVAVEPGVTFGKLQQTLKTHGRFVPPCPTSGEYSTLGGAVANNAASYKSLKYGTMRDYVQGLSVVLANGELIQTRRLSKRELGKKMGLTSFEGEIYRSLDALIEENKATIDAMDRGLKKDAAGYALSQVKRKDGSFDLTPIMVGSQGTLGIVTEVVMATEPFTPDATLIAAFCDDNTVAEQVIGEALKLSDSPSAIEMVNGTLLEFLDKTNPNLLKGIVDKPYPKMVLLIEFDNNNSRVQKKLVKKMSKILSKYQLQYRVENDENGKEELWKIRQAAGSLMAHVNGQARALPLIDDGVVPPEKLNNFIQGLQEILERYNMPAAIWGHAGNANLHAMPILDLSQVGDRQKAFRLMDEYYELVLSLGGTTTGQYGDGRLRGPYLPQLVGKDGYAVLQKMKTIFDPYGTLNPGVKINVSLETTKHLLRNDFSLQHLHGHMPTT